MFKLIAISELREFDYLLNEYIPLEKGDGNICDRCRREHAKVYVVKDDEKEYHVGSTCCKKLLNWEPSKEEVQEFEAQRKSRLQDEKKRVMKEFIDNAIVETVKQATKLNKQQGWIHCNQVESVIMDCTTPLAANRERRKMIFEKIFRKFICTPCPMRLRGEWMSDFSFI